MNFQQLRIVRETAHRQFNLTEVAHVLATSQSGVSKHIKDLEDELGVQLFIRRGKRLTGLTEPGQQIIDVVQRILIDAGSIKDIVTQLFRTDEGEFTIATTHMQARYALPHIVAEFRRRFPGVKLAMHQLAPPDIVEMLRSGRADIGIATESLTQSPDLVTFSYYQWQHAVVVPKDHPLAKMKSVALPDIAQFPVITYNHGFTGRPVIDRGFESAGLHPQIVMEAIDSDVIKAYVELGLGIGIIARQAFDPQRDQGLVLLDAEQLFDSCTSYLALRRGRFFRQFAYRFIELCRPELTERAIKRLFE